MRIQTYEWMDRIIAVFHDIATSTFLGDSAPLFGFGVVAFNDRYVTEPSHIHCICYVYGAVYTKALMARPEGLWAPATSSTHKVEFPYTTHKVEFPYTCPSNDRSCPSFPSFPVLHRLHNKIFPDGLFPPAFVNQDADPFLFASYARFNAARWAWDCVLTNEIGGHGDCRYTKASRAHR